MFLVSSHLVRPPGHNQSPHPIRHRQRPTTRLRPPRAPRVHPTPLHPAPSRARERPQQTPRQLVPHRDLVPVPDERDLRPSCRLLCPHLPAHVLTRGAIPVPSTDLYGLHGVYFD